MSTSVKPKAKMKSKRKAVVKHPGHIHLWDIPNKYFPRKSKAKLYRKEVLDFMSALDDTHVKLQHSAKIAIFDIKSVHQESIHANLSPQEVFESVSDFVYHYENYCFRLFALREKIVHFLNVVIPIGYTEKDVKITHLLINPIIKSTGFKSVLEKFKDNNVLGKIITDRNALTHKLYYEKNDKYLRPQGEVSKKWFRDWEVQIESKAKEINKAESAVSNLCNEIASKLVKYKEGG